MDIRNRLKYSDSDDSKDWWDWWLKDDPPAPAAREELRKKRVAEANAYHPRQQPPKTKEPTTQPAPANITINFNFSNIKLPKFKKLRVKFPAWPYKKIAVWLVILISVIGASVVLYHNHQKKAQAAKLAAAQAAINERPTRTTPSFTPVAPKNKPGLGTLSPSSKSTSYDGNRDTFSYMDSVQAGQQFTVSEQPLPAGLGTDQQAVATVASQISAKTPIILSNGVAYVKTEKNSTQQTIVFSIKGTLVFINSPFSHTNDIWKYYIDGLQ
jgi:hypothetical protein